MVVSWDLPSDWCLCNGWRMWSYSPEQLLVFLSVRWLACSLYWVLPPSPVALLWMMVTGEDLTGKELCFLSYNSFLLKNYFILGEWQGIL